MPSDPKRPDAPVTEEHRRIAESIADKFLSGTNYCLDSARLTQFLANYAAQVEARARLAEVRNAKHEWGCASLVVYDSMNKKPVVPGPCNCWRAKRITELEAAVRPLKNNS